MKKLAVLILCLLLCACGPAASDQSTAPSREPEDAGASEPVSSEDGDVAFDRLQYGRSFLSSPGQALYDELYAAAIAFDTAPQLPVPAEVSDTELKKVLQYLQDDNPELYWLNAEEMLARASSARVLHFYMINDLTVTDLRGRQREIDKEADWMLRDVTGDDPFSVAVSLHDRLAKHLSYSSKTNKDDMSNIYGALVGYTAICDGYARALQYMLHRVGINCIYITGVNQKGIPHAWNAIELDSGWYYADLTLNDKDPLRHDYLFMSAEESMREHVWTTEQYPELPESGDQRYDYYVHGGYAVENGGAEQIIADLAEAFATQICDRVEKPQNLAVFLEVKVPGDDEDYIRVREIMIQHLFDILAEIDVLLLQKRPELQVGDQQSLTVNFNDSMQILIYYPVVYAR